MHLPILRVHLKKSKGLMLLQCFFVFFSSDFLYKSICYGYPFELHRQVDAIQMGSHKAIIYAFMKKKTKSTLAVTEDSRIA